MFDTGALCGSFLTFPSSPVANFFVTDAVPVGVYVPPRVPSAPPLHPEEGGSRHVPLVEAWAVPAHDQNKSNPLTPPGYPGPIEQQQQSCLARGPYTVEVCPSCHSPGLRSRVRSTPTWHTWLSVFLIFLLFWPAAWIPLVWDKCKRTDHLCIRCSSVVGSIDPFSDCCVSEKGGREEHGRN